MSVKDLKQTVLITGAGGFIGGHLLKQAAEAGFNAFGTCNLSEKGGLILLDITNKSQVESVIKKIAPDVIIHCAALSNAGHCVKDKELAKAVNIGGTKNIALAAQKINAHLIYISTDLVFDGKKGNYSENDTPAPICFYGQTKFDGENEVLKVNKDFTIARLSWVYGRTVNNAKNYLDILISDLEQKKSVNLFYDEYRSPVFIDDVCNALLELAANKESGVFHLTGGHKMSRLDFGNKVCEQLGFDKSLIVKTSSDIISGLEKRPKDCSLLSNKIINKSVKFKSVEEGIK